MNGGGRTLSCSRFQQEWIRTQEDETGYGIGKFLGFVLLVLQGTISKRNSWFYKEPDAYSFVIEF